MSRYKILLTRAEGENKKTIESIKKSNTNTQYLSKIDQKKEYIFLSSPLLKRMDVKFSLPSESAYDAVLLTSVMALEGLYVGEGSARKPVYCVGEAVAQSAKEAGFSNIQNITENAAMLLERLKHHDHGETSLRLLYLRGRDITVDFVKELGDHRVREVITYMAEPVPLTENVINALRKSEIFAVTLYSTRSAKIFMECVRAHGLLSAIRPIKTLCISAAVLEYVQPYFDQTGEVADKSDARAMTDLVLKAVSEITEQLSVRGKASV